MSFHVIIPARLASTRLPNKPLADIAGVPMVVRVARQAQRSAAARVVVAADHPQIVQVCQDHGVQALLWGQRVARVGLAQRDADDAPAQVGLCRVGRDRGLGRDGEVGAREGADPEVDDAGREPLIPKKKS